MPRRTRTTALARLLPAAILAAMFAPADAPAQNAQLGKRAYMQRCAACHGPVGRGDGPMATVLKTAPRDLALLARANDGKFPFLDVYRAIDGRRTIRAHGSSEMPVWGKHFQAEALSYKLPEGMTAEQIAMARILAIVYYLQTIQLD